MIVQVWKSHTLYRKKYPRVHCSLKPCWNAKMYQPFKPNYSFNRNDVMWGIMSINMKAYMN